MRKHPVLSGILLLVATGMVYLVLSYLLQGGKGGCHLTAKVGIVPIEGIISGSYEITEQIEEFGNDDSVKAVVLRIDSPGGGVAPSQEIFQAVKEVKKKKKVVVSMGSVGASGGYLIAVAADHIVANPGTLTGSISAVMHFADIQELMKKMGVRSAVVKSGRFKDIGSPVREMTHEEKQLLQGIVDDIYDQFVETVVENRQLPRQVVESLADGRILTGRQALEQKLIDELGGLQDAILRAGQLAGIQGKPQVIFSEKQKPSIWRYLLENIAAVTIHELKKMSAGSSLGAVSLLF